MPLIPISLLRTVVCGVLLAAVVLKAASSGESQAFIEFGQALFFDARLSANGQVSCATCHQPERAFTDGLKTSRGVSGSATTRNSPSLIGVAEVPQLFWDGRVATLEAQALLPLTTAAEMGRASVAEVVQQVRDLPDYRPRLRALGVTASSLSAEHLSRALAAYQRSLRAAPTAFERYLRGETQALSAQALRGLTLFSGQAGCATCHRIDKPHAPLTDHEFHAIGFRGDPAQLAAAIRRVQQTAPAHLGQLILTDPEVAALGRFVVTGKLEDLGKFRTPSLRHVAQTAPYMHDGALATLEQAIDDELYYRGHSDGTPRILTPHERADLAAFLRAL